MSLKSVEETKIEITIQTYLIVLPGIFLAGLLDAIAGGGGLISVPTYLAAGLPSHYVLGNNKFSSAPGTILSTLRYLKKGYIDKKIAITSAIFALLGSYLGTKTVLLLNPGFLRYVLVFLLPSIAIFTFVKKDVGLINNSHTIKLIPKFSLSILAGLLIGFYDGFFGPDTGSFLILIFSILIKYDLVTANGNTKAVNSASNIAAMITFIINGKILYTIGIPAIVCGLTGNYIGSNFVIDKGGKIIRPVMIFVLILLFFKILYDLIKNS